MMRLIKFEQPNCVPCKNMADYLKSKNVDHETIVVFDHPATASRYRIRTVPVLVLVDEDEDGDEVGRTIGFKPAEIDALIAKL